MLRSRMGLMAVSAAVVVLVLGGSLALRAGAGEGSFRHVVQFSEVLGLVVDNYVDEVDTQSLLQGAYEGLMGGLDSHGAYLTPEEVTAWKKPVAPDAVDPGVSVLKAGGVFQIVAIAPGSPADEAKLVAGDQIRRIDGRSVRTLSLDQGLRLLAGPAGAKVALSVIHPHDNFRKEELTVARAKRSDPAFSVEIRDRAAVLRVRDLRRIDPDAVASKLGECRGAGAERLLVDLRGLAGGSPREAGALAGLFVSGDLLRLKDRSGKSLETVTVKGSGSAWSAPMGVLVNGATAGGSEAVAKLLQGKGATIYGESTFGLGAEARLVELPDGSGLLLSAYVWETAAGGRWNGDGIEPDKVVRGEGRPEDAESQQLQKALEELAKTAPAAKAA